MDQIFPYANVVAGVLVLLIGVGLHFGGQLFSLVDWDRATKLGLQEAGMRPEHRSYEHAIAASDVLIGWTYAVAAIGLLVDASWAYAWAWIPGVVLTYHALGFWFWTGNHVAAGVDYSTTRTPFRQTWTLANLVTGVLTILVANSQMIVP